MQCILSLVALSVFLALCNASPFTVTKDDDPGIEYRLDITEFIPKKYNVHLTLPDNFIEDKLFTGIVTIDVTRKNAKTKKLRIHRAAEIDIEYVKVDTKELSKDKYATYDNKTEIMEIEIGKTSKTDFKLEFSYSGKLYSDMYGIYLSQVTTTSENGREDYETIATTQFQPTFARRAFPCFDEPSFKATFDIALSTPVGFNVISNQPLKKTTMYDLQTFTFEQTPSMSTYLVAFVVSNFEATSVPKSSASSFPMDIWTPSELTDNAEYASTVSRKIIDNLGNILSVKFDEMKVKHLDQVAIPDFAAGAMENWGLVTYRETALLWDEKESTVKDKQRVASVIAHEFAHNWFGNWVTTAWWDNTWLNEGFATYFEYHGLMDIPEMKPFEFEKQFVVDKLQPIMETDGNAGALPLQSETFSVPQVQAKFGTISYSKGGSIVRMMEKIVGKPTFMKNLNKYINNHKTGCSVPADLFKVFADIDKVPFADVMKNWIEEAGYPVINAKLSDGKVSVAQKQFYYEKPDKKDTKWYVQISYQVLDIPKTTTPGPTTTTEDPGEETTIYDSGEEKPTEENPNVEELEDGEEYDAEYASDYKPSEGSIWLKPADTDKTITDLDESSLIIINKEHAGYYRVNYDTELWHRITNSLQANHAEIDVVSRAQLVDDAMNLARAGQLDYTTAMQLVQYLKTETEYYPWKAALTAFSYLRKRLVGDNLREQISATLTTLMEKFYNDNKNFKKDNDENPINVYKQVLAMEWACELNVGDCTTKAKDIFDKMDTRANSAISANIRSIIYCSGLRHSKKDKDEDVNNWEKLWKKYSDSDVMSEKVTILTALGCTKNTELLKAYLQRSINDTSIRPQDASSVFNAVLTGNPEGIDIALNFLNDDFDGIVEKYGSMGDLSSIITQVADRITTRTQLETLSNFVEENKDKLEEAAKVAENALIAAKANIDWADSYKDDLNQYFNPSGASALISTSFLGVLVCTLLVRFM